MLWGNITHRSTNVISLWVSRMSPARVNNPFSWTEVKQSLTYRGELTTDYFNDNPTPEDFGTRSFYLYNSITEIFHNKRRTSLSHLS